MFFPDYSDDAGIQIRKIYHDRLLKYIQCEMVYTTTMDLSEDCNQKSLNDCAEQILVSKTLAHHTQTMNVACVVRSNNLEIIRVF